MGEGLCAPGKPGPGVPGISRSPPWVITGTALQTAAPHRPAGTARTVARRGLVSASEAKRARNALLSLPLVKCGISDSKASLRAHQSRCPGLGPLRAPGCTAGPAVACGGAVPGFLRPEPYPGPKHHQPARLETLPPPIALQPDQCSSALTRTSWGTGAWVTPSSQGARQTRPPLPGASLPRALGEGSTRLGGRPLRSCVTVCSCLRGRRSGEGPRHDVCAAGGQTARTAARPRAAPGWAACARRTVGAVTPAAPPAVTGRVDRPRARPPPPGLALPGAPRLPEGWPIRF